MFSGDGRRPVAGADEVIASVSIVDDFEALAARWANDDDVRNIGVRTERMRGSDCDVPGDEDPNPHEGSTGDQDSGGSGSLLRPSRAAATPAAAASTRSAEKRFTVFSLSLLPAVPASSLMGIEIDHVVICVDNLTAAADLLRTRHGLASTLGGRHSGHGTANSIVPLGSTYLELVAVVDSDEASRSPFGRWVGEMAAPEMAPHAVCLRTDDLDLVSSKLGLEVICMSRRRPDGVELRWRLAGLSQTVTDGLPFFIEWDISDEDHPGRADLPQAAEATFIELRLTGDVGQLADWVGGAPGIRLSSGPPGVRDLRIHFQRRVVDL